MSLQDRIQSDITAAMRGGDALRRDVLRMVANAAYNVEKATGATARPTTSSSAVLTREVKTRRESVEAFRKPAAARTSPRKEEAEIAILGEYLPAAARPRRDRGPRRRGDRRDRRGERPRHGQGHGLARAADPRPGRRQARQRARRPGAGRRPTSPPTTPAHALRARLSTRTADADPAPAIVPTAFARRDCRALAVGGGSWSLPRSPRSSRSTSCPTRPRAPGRRGRRRRHRGAARDRRTSARSRPTRRATRRRQSAVPPQYDYRPEKAIRIAGRAARRRSTTQVAAGRHGVLRPSRRGPREGAAQGRAPGADATRHATTLARARRRPLEGGPGRGRTRPRRDRARQLRDTDVDGRRRSGCPGGWPAVSTTASGCSPPRSSPRSSWPTRSFSPDLTQQARDAAGRGDRRSSVDDHARARSSSATADQVTRPTSRRSTPSASRAAPTCAGSAAGSSCRCSSSASCSPGSGGSGRALASHQRAAARRA